MLKDRRLVGIRIESFKTNECELLLEHRSSPFQMGMVFFQIFRTVTV